MQYLGSSSKMMEWSWFISKAKPFNITVTQVYAPITDAEEAEADWFYEDPQHLLELTPKKKTNKQMSLSSQGIRMQK